VIAELQTLRNFLQVEGTRVEREIAEYAHLSQSAMQTTNVIAENVARLKGDANANNQGGDKAMPPDPGSQERCRATTGLRPDGGYPDELSHHKTTKFGHTPFIVLSSSCDEFPDSQVIARVGL
jgi:hypothetical protein